MWSVESVTQMILSLFIASLTISACGDRNPSRYRAHCVESLGCEEDLVISSSITRCESDWYQREREAVQADCNVEFEYYFECFEEAFFCGRQGQSCFSLYQEYQICLARDL